MTELEFIQAVAINPHDDATRLAYADFLEELGDPRSEFLRYTVQIREKRWTSEQRVRHHSIGEELGKLIAESRREYEEHNRLHPPPPRGSVYTQGEYNPPPINRERTNRINKLQQELLQLGKCAQPTAEEKRGLQFMAEQCDPKWLAVVSDPLVEGCGIAGSLRWHFVCTKGWADMTPTDDPNVRTCNACNESVHYCDNIADARREAHRSGCIALDVGIPRGTNGVNQDDLDGPMAIFGQPSEEHSAENYLDGLDRVSKQRVVQWSRERREAFKGRTQIVWAHHGNGFLSQCGE
jgi:uncharacterized protein (TIGR02996 family)